MRSAELSTVHRERLSAARWLPDVGPFSAFGRAWKLLTDDAAFAELITDLYADVAVDTLDGSEIAQIATFRALVRDRSGRSLVTRDDQLIGGGNAPAATMAALVWGINRWVLDEASRHHLLLHAGGVVCEDGVAVVLPAPSEAGKTTLTTGLLSRGLAYLSDEAIAVRSDGTVSGYPKPLSIDPGAWAVLASHRPHYSPRQMAFLARQWHVPGSRISRSVQRGTIGAVIFPRYARGDETVMTPLGPGEALIRAGNCTFAPGNGKRVEVSQIEGLAVALSGIPSYELVSGDLDGACDAVLGVLRAVAVRQPVIDREKATSSDRAGTEHLT